MENVSNKKGGLVVEIELKNIKLIKNSLTYLKYQEWRCENEISK